MGKVSSILALALITTLATARVTANNTNESIPPQPSRYAGQDTASYIASISPLFSIAKRVTDPFCQPQDPNAKPVIRPNSKTLTRRTTTVEPTKQLSNIVGQIPITTIMPRERRFLVGSRSISEGDTLTLNHQNKLIHTKVAEVTSGHITFINTETGEQAVRTLSMLPAGMTPGKNQITPTGMLRDQANTPLEIGSVTDANKP
jgi:hypothetical protein